MSVGVGEEPVQAELQAVQEELSKCRKDLGSVQERGTLCITSWMPSQTNSMWQRSEYNCLIYNIICHIHVTLGDSRHGFSPFPILLFHQFYLHIILFPELHNTHVCT